MGDPQRTDGRATGTAIWEASHVLGEWLSRQGERLSSIEDAGPLVPGRPWKRRKTVVGVELGAGLGLPSLVASHLGVRMVATDGDPAVLELLSQNAKALNVARGTDHGVRVQELLWGSDFPLTRLGLKRSPGLLLAADVVYASGQAELSAQLIATIRALCNRRTLVLLANVRRFPWDHPKGEGKFFAHLDHYFERAEIPQHCLHKEFQRTGIGSCVVHALRRRRLPKHGIPSPLHDAPAIETKRVLRARRPRRQAYRETAEDTPHVDLRSSVHEARERLAIPKKKKKKKTHQGGRTPSVVSSSKGQRCRAVTASSGGLRRPRPVSSGS